MTRTEQIEQQERRAAGEPKLAAQRRRSREQIVAIKAFGPRVLRHLDIMSGEYVERAWYSQTECEIAKAELEDEMRRRRAI